MLTISGRFDVDDRRNLMGVGSPNVSQGFFNKVPRMEWDWLPW